MQITYTKGDATSPTGTGHKIIVHVCNDVGKRGKGFVLALSKRWKTPESIYKSAFSLKTQPQLGDMLFADVEPTISVANLIGQHGIRNPRNNTTPPPIRYQAIEKGLHTVAAYAEKERASIHMPRIGCGLAGGSWHEIEPIINLTLTQKNIPVTVYDFE